MAILSTSVVGDGEGGAVIKLRIVFIKYSNLPLFNSNKWQSSWNSFRTLIKIISQILINFFDSLLPSLTTRANALPNKAVSRSVRSGTPKCCRHPHAYRSKQTTGSLCLLCGLSTSKRRFRFVKLLTFWWASSNKRKRNKAGCPFWGSQLQSQMEIKVIADFPNETA